MNLAKIRVALIDDNILFRKGLKALISSFGAFAVQADEDDAARLIAKLKNAKTVPDICILSSDALMLNNNQALKEIKGSLKNVKVLVLVRHYYEFAVYKMLYDGANGYLLKDCQPAELKKVLLAIHATGTYWEPDILDTWPNTRKSDYTISKSQAIVLSFCATNLTYTEMAERMRISPRTIDG